MLLHRMTRSGCNPSEAQRRFTCWEAEGNARDIIDFRFPHIISNHNPVPVYVHPFVSSMPLGQRTKLRIARVDEGALSVRHAGSGWVGEENLAIGLERPDKAVACRISLEKATDPSCTPSAEVSIEHHRSFPLLTYANGNTFVSAPFRRSNVPTHKRSELHAAISPIAPVAFSLFSNLLRHGSMSSRCVDKQEENNSS
mgnify:CR=1 FL=1